MTEEPPRLRHNRELSAAYMKANKVYSRYPKVTEQVETVPLDMTKLFPFGYNPSIIEFGGKMLMAYRYHQGTAATKIALWDGTTNEPIKVPDAPSAEDPKLFVWCDELFMSVVVSRWPDMARSVVRYGRLYHGELLDVVQPAHGKNDWSEMEKNWVCFENPGGYDNHGGQLHILYRSGVTQHVYIPSMIETLKAAYWPYGLIKGGSQPMLYEGKWLRFFHSTLNNELNPQQRRRYYVGALMLEPTPPFDCIRTSRKPIIYGSEVDNLTKDQRKACSHWKPQVVFPGTAIQRDGCWWLSLGVNDSACVIAVIKPEQLNF